MTTPDERWADDSIQFPRLLTELFDVGITNGQWADVLAAMDLTGDQLMELFDRAQAAWDKQKESV